MSTRATYEIFGHTFYVHHDGYEQGAAHKFVDMIQADSERDQVNNQKNQGGLAANFLRGNARACFAKSHEQHADTEFRYTIREKDFEPYLLVEAYCWESDRFKQSFSGSLFSFIEQYCPGKVLEVPGHGLMTRDNLIKLASKNTELLEKWEEKKLLGVNYNNLSEKIRFHISLLKDSSEAA